MSHITTIDLQVKDLDAMQKACERLGLELIRGQKTFVGYTQGTCDHAIRVKEVKATIAGKAFEIGLVPRPDGKGYSLAWDGHMGPTYGPSAPLYNATGYGLPVYGQAASTSKLRDWYAAEVSKKQMRKQGFRVNAIQKDRKVHVLCSK